MTTQEIMDLQNMLREAGFYTATVDGVWGDKSKAALAAYQNALKISQASCTPTPAPATKASDKLIWGSKVTQEFKDSVRWIAEALQLPGTDGPNWLMACMAFESGRSFNPAIKNAAGSGAVGLIQFMPTTAKSLGTSIDALAKMTPVQQLNYVFKYFSPQKGKLKNLGDVYMAILWPAGVGKDDSYVLWNKDTKPTTYRQNAGLDVNKDGNILRGEALAKIRAMYDEGKNYQG